MELNIQVQSGREVAQIQDWFETHWAAAEDVTTDVLRAITRHTAEFTPFDVYARALHEFFGAANSQRGSGTSRSRACSASSIATSRRRTGR